VPFSWVALSRSWLTPWFLCGDGLFSFTPFVPYPLSFLLFFLFFLSFCFFPAVEGLWATSFFLTTKRRTEGVLEEIFSPPRFSSKGKGVKELFGYSPLFLVVLRPVGFFLFAKFLFPTFSREHRAEEEIQFCLPTHPFPSASCFTLRHCYHCGFHNCEMSFFRHFSLVLFSRWFHDTSVPFFPLTAPASIKIFLLKYPTHHTPGIMYTTGGPPAHNNKDVSNFSFMCFLFNSQTETCLCFLHFKTEGKEPGKNASVPFSWVALSRSWLTPWFLCGDGLFSFTPFVPYSLSFLLFLLFFLSFCFSRCGGLWATSFFLTTKRRTEGVPEEFFLSSPVFPRKEKVLRSCLATALCFLLFCVLWGFFLFAKFLFPTFSRENRAEEEIQFCFPRAEKMSEERVESHTVEDTTPPKEEERNVERIAAYLGVKPRFVKHLPAAILEEVVGKLAFDLGERARLSIWLSMAAAGGEQTRDLAQFFREKEEKEVYPWKAAEKRAGIQLEHARAAFAEPEGFENLRRTFCAQAKAGALSEVEAFVCHYLLFFPDPEFARFLLASLLLNTPPAQRLSIHNWAVAKTMATSRREAYGEKVAALGVPLFPEATGELAALNARILNEAVLSGGGPQALQRRKGAQHFTNPPGERLWGAGNLMVSTAPNGQAYVDIAPVEVAFVELQRRTGELQQAVAALSAQAAQPQQQQQQQQQQQHQQPWRARGRGYERGRGQPRGGYAYNGRGRGWYGAGAPEDPEPKNGEEAH